jgi:hypothetical protein
MRRRSGQRARRRPALGDDCEFDCEYESTLLVRVYE